MKIVLSSMEKGDGNYFLIYGDGTLDKEIVQEMSSAESSLDKYIQNYVHEVVIDKEVQRLRIEYYINQDLDLNGLNKREQWLLKLMAFLLTILEVLGYLIVGTMGNLTETCNDLVSQTGVEIEGRFSKNDTIRVRSFYPNTYVFDENETIYERNENLRTEEDILLKLFEVTECSTEYTVRQFYNWSEEELQRIVRRNCIKLLGPLSWVLPLTVLLVKWMGFYAATLPALLVWGGYLAVFIWSVKRKLQQYREILRRRENGEDEILLKSQPLG